MKSVIEKVYEIEKLPGLYLGKNSLDLLDTWLSGYVHANVENNPYYKHYSKEFNLYIEMYYRKKRLERIEQVREVIKLQKEVTDATQKAAYEKKLNEIEVFSSKNAAGLIREHTQSDSEAMWEYFRLFHQFVEEMEVLD